MNTPCVPLCWLPVKCPACGNPLPPRGRAMPQPMAINACCDEARMNRVINPRHLWSADEADAMGEL